MTIAQRSPASPDRPVCDHDWSNGIKRYLWDADLHLERRGPRAILFVALSGLAVVAQLCLLGPGGNIPKILSPDQVRIFLNVKPASLSDFDASVASLLVAMGLARIAFASVIGLADIALYRRLTGRPYDWDGLLNFAVVNALFLHTGLFTVMNPAFEAALAHYRALADHLPTLINFGGPAAILCACLIADFCFYWSHRWCHGIRLFWNLGHINHHRASDLSQLTVAVDPPALFLDAAGGRVFALLLVPLLTKLFSVDARDCVWALLAAMLIDALANPSHSVALYEIELRSRALRALRLVFVTPAVHFTHHSREKRHDIACGCNFGARFALWDRLFGTWAEPPAYIPPTGLFDDNADYCRTPLRFVFHPCVRMFGELRRNEWRHWPAIVFGPAAYEPPIAADTEP